MSVIPSAGTNSARRVMAQALVESHLLHDRRMGHKHLEHAAADEPGLGGGPEMLRHHLLPGVDESRGRLLAVVTGPGQEAAHQPTDGLRSCGRGFIVRHAVDRQGDWSGENVQKPRRRPAGQSAASGMIT